MSGIQRKEAESKMSYIRFENVIKNFGTVNVLKNINLEIEKGELVTLLGPSGCGKSTLLRCLAGLEAVTSGHIFLEGKDITKESPKNREMGMVFQQYSLFPNMTIEQNIAFGLKIKKIPAEQQKQQIEEILEIVGLSAKTKAYPGELSGGQQQRAALARAIVTKPKVLLLDEPLSAIDAKLRRSLQMEIRRIQKELDITAIFVTHDQEEAMVMSDTIHLLYQGNIEQSDTPLNLYVKPETRFAASFIGHYNLFSAEEFQELAEKKIDAKDIAFRPEVVCLHKEAPDSEDSYVFSGKIRDCMSHGNTLRYAFDCHGKNVDVDALFTSGREWNPGDSCFLSIHRNDCVLLGQE